MTLNDLFDEWGSVTYERKLDALKAVIKFIEQPYQKDEELINDMLLVPYDLESDDYFGTEGLKF